MAPTRMNNCNEDELEAPDWLNKDFFLKVLKSAEHTEEIKVKNLHFEPASAKGDHYASVMFRATIVYSLKNLEKIKKIIIKTMPEYEGNKTELFGDSRIFETEIGMYTEIIPKFEAILRNIGDNTQLGAKCLYHELSPKKIIIFEDIVPLGYTVMRERQMILSEVKTAYAKLAKWHAISYKLNHEDPHVFDDYSNGLFLQKNLTDLDFFNDGIFNFIELLETHEDLRQYIPYFKPYVGKIVNECVKIFNEARENPQTNGLYVLCHGDFHYKNLMFKHDVQTHDCLDVMLLDFQMCYVGPMVNDVLYSTYMMLDANLRKNHLDELHFFYFTTFQDTLKKIGFKGKIPKIFDFKQELMRHKIFDLYMFTSFLPTWYVFTEATMDVDEMLKNAQKRKTAWKDPRYIKEAKELLPKFLQMGYLET